MLDGNGQLLWLFVINYIKYGLLFGVVGVGQVLVDIDICFVDFKIQVVFDKVFGGQKFVICMVVGFMGVLDIVVCIFVGKFIEEGQLGDLSW